MSQISCKNCNSKTNGKYCNSCGQRTSINEVSFKETFNDILNAVFSIEAPLIITFKILFVNPGKLFKDFFNGKRKYYYKPVSFFIFTTILFVLLSDLLNYNPFHIEPKEIDQDKLALLINNATIFFAKNINNMLLVFVLTYGFILKLFFYDKYKLIETIIISFYTIGLYTFFTTLSMISLEYLSHNFQILSFILTGFYVIYSNISFLKKINFIIIFKLVVVYFLSFVSFSLLSIGLSALILWFKNF